MNAARPLARAEVSGVVAELWPCAPYEVRDVGRAGVIGFAYEAQAGEDAVASDRVRAFRRGASTLSWVPPGCDVFSASCTGGEYLVLRGFKVDAVGHPDGAVRAVNDAVDQAALRAAGALRRLLVCGAGS